MIEAKFHQMIAECHQRFSPAWYKTYREKPLDKLATEVLEYMENWEMVSVDPIFRTVTIYPLAVNWLANIRKTLIPKEKRYEQACRKSLGSP